jgi:hypothetical protein
MRVTAAAVVVAMVAVSLTRTADAAAEYCEMSVAGSASEQLTSLDPYDIKRAVVDIAHQITELGKITRVDFWAGSGDDPFWNNEPKTIQVGIVKQLATGEFEVIDFKYFEKVTTQGFYSMGVNFNVFGGEYLAFSWNNEPIVSYSASAGQNYYCGTGMLRQKVLTVGTACSGRNYAMAYHVCSQCLLLGPPDIGDFQMREKFDVVEDFMVADLRYTAPWRGIIDYIDFFAGNLGNNPAWTNKRELKFAVLTQVDGAAECTFRVKVVKTIKAKKITKEGYYKIEDLGLKEKKETCSPGI